MADFSIAYQKTSVFEGGYSNDARDRGGETYKGISRKFHPDWGGWSILDLMNDKNTKNSQLQSLVNSFYYNEFWAFLKCDEFDQPIADELFDTAVNQGKITAAKYLQESLNLLNNNQRHYKDITVDGEIGNVTINAYKEYMSTSDFPGRSKEKNINTLLKVLNGLQFERYKDIVKRSPDQEIYFYGWLQRVKKNENETETNMEVAKRKENNDSHDSNVFNSTNSISSAGVNPRADSECINDNRLGVRRSRTVPQRVENTNRTKFNTYRNKTEKEVSSLIKFKLRINIKLRNIKKFLRRIKLWKQEKDF
jgi:lysozyme family protein